MIAFMQATFHALQSVYAAAEALYNSGPAIMNGGMIVSIVLLGCIFVRTRGK